MASLVMNGLSATHAKAEHWATAAWSGSGGSVVIVVVMMAAWNSGGGVVVVMMTSHCDFVV
jgi:hypothetical protein